LHENSRPRRDSVGKPEPPLGTRPVPKTQRWGVFYRNLNNCAGRRKYFAVRKLELSTGEKVRLGPIRKKSSYETAE